VSQVIPLAPRESSVTEKEDFLKGFLEISEGLPTAPIFRLWSGIATVAASMERRTWVWYNRQLLFPNLFVLLCGVPASGKSQAIKPARRLLKESKAAFMAPDDMTKAFTLDELSNSKRRILYKGTTMEYHPLCIMAPEFGTLVNAHDLEFFSLLNKLFDNEDEHRSGRRGHHGGKEIHIPYPTINILAGTQPGYLASLLPEEAWHMGTTSRLMMIYAAGAEPRATSPFDRGDDPTELHDSLVAQLAEMAKQIGEFVVTPEARLAVELWLSAGLNPVPEHPRLIYYNGRREIYVMKLAMIAAMSRAQELVITLADVQRAKSWMLSAENAMPDIFRDMHLKSDATLMNECHRFVMAMWVESSREISQRKPIHKSDVMRFLALRCPADKAERVLETMVMSDWLALDHNNPMLYHPRARGFRTDE
jgi:hypothetical protein